MEKEPTRVLIVDDHPLLRQGIRMVLEMTEGVQVMGEARDGAECLDAVERFQPDVVLLDLTMPGLGGIEAGRAIKERWPDVGVVVLTMHDSEDYLLEAVRAGVDGYVLKDVQPEDLVAAVRICAGGGSFIQPSLVGRLMAGLRRREEGGSEKEGPGTLLTPREREVIALLAQGASNREIAARLVLSEKTVKNHVTSILRKLQVQDRTQAAVEAYRRGWVRFE